MKECIACFEEIKSEAKLCRYCQTLQDDPRFQVSTISSPPVDSRVKGPEAKSNVELQDSTELAFCLKCKIRLDSDQEKALGLCHADSFTLDTDVARDLKEFGNPGLCDGCHENVISKSNGPFCSSCITSGITSRSSVIPELESGAPRNVLSVTALTLGIVSAFLPIIFIIPISAITFGAIALNRGLTLREIKGAQHRTGMAIAGLVLGIVYLGIGLYQIGINQG